LEGHVARMEGGGGEMYTEFWWGNLREGDHLEDSGESGNITFKMRLKEMWWEGVVGWINLAQDRTNSGLLWRL